MTPDTNTRRVTLRELDALVAEHVMGWEPLDSGLQGYDRFKDGGRTRFTGAPHPLVLGLFRPSTDWSHTGKALDKAPYSSTIDIDPDGHTSVAINDGSRGTLATAQASTKEAACCLALVRAYSVEVELETEVDS